MNYFLFFLGFFIIVLGLGLGLGFLGYLSFILYIINYFFIKCILSSLYALEDLLTEAYTRPKDHD